MSGWYDVFNTIALVIILALAIVAVVFIGKLDEIDTDDENLSVIATADGASLSNSPSVALRFVNPANGIIMSFPAFTATLVGANSFLSTQTPISDDFWPTSDLYFPIVVQNNGTFTTGHMTILTTGIIHFHVSAGADLFTVGTITIQGTGVSWTNEL